MATTASTKTTTAAATTPLPPRTYAAQGAAYTLRSLSEDESEIDAWCHFCASVFVDKKPVPPSADYFARHYYNDPNRQASLIRVATVRRRSGGKEEEEEEREEEEIVASCRVFLRRIYVRRNDNNAGNYEGSDEVDVGGIGEVCTSVRHRRKGLSRELLNDCVQMMRQQAQLKLSFLHSAPAFFPVYESAGYCRTRTAWRVVPYHHGLHASSSDGTPVLPPSLNGCPSGATVVVRRANFPQDAVQLSAMYSELYSGVSGCLVRTREYWETYLGREWKDQMWVATAGSEDATRVGSSNDDDAPILGYMAARFRGMSASSGNRRVQICDVGCLPPSRFDDDNDETAATSSSKDAADSAASAAVFGALLSRAVQELCRRAKSFLLPSETTFDLVLPDVAAHKLQPPLQWLGTAWVDWRQSRVEIDEGWMYKALVDGDGDDNDSAGGPVVHRLRSGAHLMWPADSF
jgi:predicted GNAT family N-acyltransferase